MTTIQASNLTLEEVHRLFGYQKEFDGSFTSLLSLEPLTEFEQQELKQIRADFDAYLTSGRASEGQIKLVVISPLLRLAGFFRSPIKIKLEEGIARINIQNEETTITGRFDILAVDKNRTTANNVDFWILVIETKESLAAPLAGLAQLLTYAYQGLQNQEAVWGLTTNGESYRFLYIQQGETPTYTLMPELNLLDEERLWQLLQVLKAIRK